LPRRGLATVDDQRPANAALRFAAKSPHVGINLHWTWIFACDGGDGVYFSRTVLFWDAVYFRFMASRMTARKERQAFIRSVPIATAHPTGWTGELLAVAVRHHRSGALAEAERRYQEILAIDPKHAESLHSSAVLHISSDAMSRH
jgi:hypothetical protein